MIPEWHRAFKIATTFFILGIVSCLIGLVITDYVSAQYIQAAANIDPSVINTKIAQGVRTLGSFFDVCGTGFFIISIPTYIWSVLLAIAEKGE